MNIHLTSTSNPKIKWVKSLHKNSTRREAGVFLVEGAKEITMAIDGGFTPTHLFVCPEIFEKTDAAFNSLNPLKDFLKFQNLQAESNQILKQARHGDMPVVQDDKYEILTVTKDVVEKISYRGSSDGLLGVFETKTKSVKELNLGENPLILVVESVEKPGNLGAIIRTADGAGVDGVIVCDPKCDIFNPNVIRSSVGTIFNKQVVSSTNQEVLDFLQNNQITTYGAILSEKSMPYTEADFSGPTAIVLGTEHEGLSDFWKKKVQPIAIPMLGVNDSLNVSNAAAVLAYEAVRQRNLAGSE